jgi:hypothetical protein
MIADYTALAMGTRVEGGVIKVCPKCERRGLHIEMSGHSFYTHFQFRNTDNPRNVFIRRVECHVLADDIGASSRMLRLPQSSAAMQRV